MTDGSFFGAPNYPTWALVRWIGEIEQWRNEAFSLCDPEFDDKKAMQHMRLIWSHRMKEWLGERLPSPFADFTLHAYDMVDWAFVVRAFRKRDWWPKSIADMLSLRCGNEMP